MQIELKNITKTYSIPETEIKRTVLQDVSLSINQGDSFGIVGPSGSGKSTLLNIIGTLDSPTSGIVSFNNEEINSYSTDKLAELRNQKIGFVFQMHHLLPQLNVLENVLIPTIPLRDKGRKQESLKRAKELLEGVGLIDKITHLPSQMSVGECQRTAVVRALINEPEIILADEPTGSLDQENAEALGNLLVEIQKERNVTLIVVTHSSELANKLENAYKLVNGKLS